MKAYACVECGAVATRAYCYAACPWRPYCAVHPPQYGTAGDIAIEDLPRALATLRHMLKYAIFKEPSPRPTPPGAP